MDWWPDLSKIPVILKVIFEVICKRIDAVTPQDGQGTRVTDAAGGRGKVIDSTGGSNGGGVVPKCFFLVNGVRKLGDVRLMGGLRDVPPEEP